MRRVICAFGVYLALTASAAVLQAQVPAGPMFLVNTYTTGPQNPNRGRTVAAAANGDFVVVWQQRPGAPAAYYNIYGQRFTAAGVHQGSSSMVNTVTGGHRLAGAVTADARGDFVVVWVSSDAPGFPGGIKGQRFDSSGAAVGQEFRVETNTVGPQLAPSIASDRVGNFVVAWTSEPHDGSSSGVFGQRFDATGARLGGEFQVNTYTTGAQVWPAVAMNADGDFIVAWSSAGQDGSDLGIYAQRYDRSGALRGAEFRVNTYTPDRQYEPSVDADREGGFIVAWSSRGQDLSLDGIFAQRYDSGGTVQGGEFQVHTYTSSQQQRPSVAADDLGNFTITWVSFGQPIFNVFGQRFDSSGQRRGAEFRVSSDTTFASVASIASDANGNFVVAWAGPDGDANGMFGQRFGGLRPTALAIDIAGNQVLEPGEAADVRPSWRNFNGAAQTFGGRLVSFNGPPGPVYSIVDPDSSYGLVSNDAIAQCADCYAVSVSTPITRPVLHWDATAVESILPDAHGQQKEWLLHVGQSFTDVPITNPFYRFIETLLHHGVTGGCTTTTYCPTSPATREQMALFVLVAKEAVGYVPPSCTTPMFADVQPSSGFCRWIEELARRGVVAGCGGGNYCPFHAVTREQMAVFVLRTLDSGFVPPACTTPIYDDVPASSGFCRWIEELTRRAVVTGCGGGNYCPAAAVTREQMGVFISAGFSLALYGP